MNPKNFCEKIYFNLIWKFHLFYRFLNSEKKRFYDTLKTKIMAYVTQLQAISCRRLFYLLFHSTL